MLCQYAELVINRTCKCFYTRRRRGGTGLAYFLASNGIKTAVCDQNPYFGGTSVYSGVNCWEPGVSFDDTAMTNALRAVFAPLNNNLIPLFGRSFADIKHKRTERFARSFCRTVRRLKRRFLPIVPEILSLCAAPAVITR